MMETNTGLAQAIRLTLRNEYPAALKLCREITELDGADWWTWVMLAWTSYRLRGPTQEMEHACRKIVEVKPDSPWGWYLLGECLCATAEGHQGAERAYRKVLEIAPTFAAAWLGLSALLLDDAARHDDAEKACRKAIELEPDMIEAWVQLGMILMRSAKCYDTEKGLYKITFTMNENVAGAWVLYGLLHFPKEDCSVDAQRAFRKAIELAPKAHFPWYMLGQLLERDSSRYEEAEAAYRQCLALNPMESRAWLALIVLIGEKRGDRSAAMQLCEDLMRDHVHETAVLYQVARGLLIEKHSDFLGKAEDMARCTIKEDPGITLHRHLLALILSARGSTDEALEYTRQCMRDSDFASQRRADVVELFISLAATDVASQASAILEGMSCKDDFEPLLVGLQLFTGKDVTAAAEVMEVARDVVKRIEKRRDEIQAQQAKSAPSKPERT
jgi:tetratricopeptide (TPR) repeat protein